MKLVLLDQPQPYDGLQLATAFVDRHAAGASDVMILFEGEADVPTSHLVDQDDAEAGETIYSPWMAHVLLEHRGADLAWGVLAQRLLVRVMADWLARRTGLLLDVRGNDLFVHGRKLSVSVATRSPRGVLVHLGLNVRTEGAPVPAAGLAELRVAPREFLQAAGRAWSDEIESVRHATLKVRPVP